MIIPFGVGPAVVAGGWAGIILRMRDHPPWLLLGIGSALIGLALVAASLLCLVVFGPQGRDAGARVRSRASTPSRPGIRSCDGITSSATMRMTNGTVSTTSSCHRKTASCIRDPGLWVGAQPTMP
jgi:hypothetical protein